MTESGVYPHDTLIPTTLEPISEEDTNTLVVCVEDNVIGILHEYDAQMSSMKVTVEGKEFSIKRKTENLFRIPLVKHHLYCSNSIECLLCELNKLDYFSFSNSQQSLPSSSSITSCSMSQAKKHNKLNRLYDATLNSTSKHSHHNRQMEEETLNDEKLQKSESYAHQKKITIRAQDIVTPTVFPYPKEFMVNPKVVCEPKKVVMHKLNLKAEKKERVVSNRKMIEESIMKSKEVNKEESFIFIRKIDLLNIIKSTMKEINKQELINEIINSHSNLQFCSVENSNTGICDVIQLIRLLNIMIEGNSRGRIIIPKLINDPIEDSYSDQLSSIFFNKPLPFIMNEYCQVTKTQESTVMNVPTIICSTQKYIMNEGVKDMKELYVETSFNDLSNWINKHYYPFGYSKDVEYILIGKKEHESVMNHFKESIEEVYKSCNLGEIRMKEKIICLSQDKLEERLKGLKNSNEIIFVFHSYDHNDQYNDEDLYVYTKYMKLNMKAMVISTDLFEFRRSQEYLSKICFEIYNRIRRYTPSQYINTLNQSMPSFNSMKNQLYEPVYVLLPKSIENEYRHIGFVAFKILNNKKIVSCFMNFTGEIEEVSYNNDLFEMWNNWCSFIQSTTRTNWTIVITKIGDITELDVLNSIKEDSYKQYCSNDDEKSNLFSDIIISQINVYDNMTISEEEYALLDNNKGLFIINDERDKEYDENMMNACYYTLLPHVNNGNTCYSSCGGYSVKIAEKNEEKLAWIMQHFHNLSFLNSYPLMNGRWSILPKHIQKLQKLDLMMDLVDLCDD